MPGADLPVPCNSVSQWRVGTVRVVVSVKGDMPGALFFQSQLAMEGSRSSIWVPYSSKSFVVIIPSLGYLSLCLVG